MLICVCFCLFVLSPHLRDDNKTSPHLPSGGCRQHMADFLLEKKPTVGDHIILPPFPSFASFHCPCFRSPFLALGHDVIIVLCHYPVSICSISTSVRMFVCVSFCSSPQAPPYYPFIPSPLTHLFVTNTLGVFLLLTKTLHGFVTADTLVVAVLLRDLLGVLYIFVCLLHSLLLQFLLGSIRRKSEGGSLGNEKWNIAERRDMRVGKKK